MKSNSSRTPLLVTMDLELANDHELAEQEAILDQLRYDLNRLALPISIFATASAAIQFGSALRTLVSAGHELGCHGLTHLPEEDYRTMDEATARATTLQASQKLSDVTGEWPTAFRGPFMMTSPATQRALIATGYIS